MFAIHSRVLMIGCIAVLLSSGCEQKAANAPRPETIAPKGGTQMKLTSSAFKDGQAIPKKYTGEGDDVSPPLAWDEPPKGTQELALIGDDPDAPSAQPWVHWVIYGIAPDTRALPEGVKSDAPQLTE